MLLRFRHCVDNRDDRSRIRCSDLSHRSHLLQVVSTAVLMAHDTDAV